MQRLEDQDHKDHKDTMVHLDPLVMLVNEVDLVTLDHLVWQDLKGNKEISELREFVELLESKDQKVELVWEDHQD